MPRLVACVLQPADRRENQAFHNTNDGNAMADSGS